MNKKNLLLNCACCLLLLLCAAPALAQNALTLRMTSAYMDRHPAYLGAFVPWMQELEAASEGRLKVRYHNPNTLCPEAEMFSAVAAGVADLGANGHGRTPGRFPLAGVIDLPLLFPDAATGSVVFQQLYEQSPELQAETADVKILWNYVSAPHILHTTKPVTSLEDLRNMKIIAWAPMAVEILRSLGANPIQAVPQESYLSVQRGMADGVLCPLSTLRSFKISEAVSHTTEVVLMVDSFWFGMAPQRWDSLSPDLQEIIMEVSEDMSARTGAALDQGALAEREILSREGHTFHSLEPAELERWRQAMQPLYEHWQVEAAALGQADADLLGQVQTLLTLDSE